MCKTYRKQTGMFLFYKYTGGKAFGDDRENVLFLNKTYFVKVFLEYRTTKCYGIGLNKA